VTIFKAVRPPYCFPKAAVILLIAPKIARKAQLQTSLRSLYDKMTLGEPRFTPMVEDKWANPQKVWDERYSQPEAIYGYAPNAFLVQQAARFRKGVNLLLPGDGYGRNGIWLARQGFQVHSVDLSPVAVDRSRALAQAAGVQLKVEQADLATWTWPLEQFDAVMAIFLHLPPDVRAKVHKSMLQAIKPGGLIVLQAFSPAQLKHSSGGPKQVELLYTAEILRQDFAPALPLELEEREIEIDEGHMHRGLAGVVQAVFQK
jgi:SAM-dependent methyltransferase